MVACQEIEDHVTNLMVLILETATVYVHNLKYEKKIRKEVIIMPIFYQFAWVNNGIKIDDFLVRSKKLNSQNLIYKSWVLINISDPPHTNVHHTPM